MSRIYDALKKSESERDPALTTDVRKAVATGQSGRPFPAEVVLPGTSQRTPALQSDLRLQDVLARCSRPEWHPDPRANLFLDPSKHLPVTEQFRTLRLRLYQLRSQQSLRTIIVTSATASEGKTLISGNLAQAIVRQDQRSALLIDADLRRPCQHLVLGAPFKPGLSDYLRGDADEMAVIQNGQEGNLFFIAGGQPVQNPSELLSGHRLKMLLERAVKAFDWVIIDSPPCLPVADARIMADVCDGVLLVIKAGSTSLEAAQKAQQTFDAKKIVGVVLNRVEEDALVYSSYYSTYYHSADQQTQ
jgi:protein-tyrosine kinase